jgi:hypothetical protein
MSSEMSSYQPEEMTEKDQKSILMIGGIQIFLPDSPVEARACVAEAATEERTTSCDCQEKLEQTLEATQVEEEDEHSEEWLKIFSQEAETERLQHWSRQIDFSEEEELDMLSFVDLWEQIETLERRVEVQSMHIQQMKLEADEGEFQAEEQLEEAGHIPAREMEVAALSDEEAEQQVSQEKTATEWTLSATQGEVTVKLSKREAEQ